MSKLELKNLSVGYDNNALISDISLLVQQGNIVALIGPNGAGKSTILRTVAGFLDPVAGNVLYADKDLSSISGTERAKLMSVMMTGRHEAEYMTCFDVVSVGRYQFTGVLGRLCEKDKDAIDEALKKVGAFDLRDKEFSKLSDGQKQRILLARALVQEPKIMILDEPTSFLDIGYKLEFAEKLKSLVKEKNIGVLMAMHELELVRNIADYVACISRDGTLEKVGTPDEIFKRDYIKKLFGIKSIEFEEIYGFIDKETVTNSKNVKTTTSKINNTSKMKEKKTASIGNSDKKRTAFLMIQGTMSSAGKSLIAAGLCRIFKQDGYRVSPFKSQNMALNSYITDEGLEMGRAQVFQAEAAGVKPSVYMNPILLKPTDDSGSQVIVNGKVIGNMRAREYFEYKKKLIPDILSAIEHLEEKSDIIVIEGAGSPAEINLKQNDIVNMGMAEMVDAPVLLVGDIDRGGVFAQLLGTLELLEEDERKRVKGLIVNKFRGDKTILDPGIEMLEKMGNVLVTGVVPYVRLNLEDEDSLTERFTKKSEGLIKIGIIRMPHISNFTDFDVFEQIDGLAVNYISNIEEVADQDMIILPGSKNTISDMKWLKESGFETAIKKYASKDKPLIGICGGYQMLGQEICDPSNVEGGGSITGLCLLPLKTILKDEKHRSQTEGEFVEPTGVFAELKGTKYSGYEIHMGETVVLEEMKSLHEFTSSNSGYCSGNIYGTYVHGIFDESNIVKVIVRILASIKGVDLSLDSVMDHKSLKEKEYDRLADVLREYMDMDYIYNIMGVER
ncbi:MAG: cobyric acid synthase [Eubacterium sp.]|nr:cobyric acid synthase [Eubacterium sp.]